MGAIDALKKKATGTTAAKSKTPVVDLPQDLLVKATKLATAYKELKGAQSAFDVAEGDIIPEMLELHTAQCIRDKAQCLHDNEVHPSIKFRSPDVSGTFTVKNQLCKIDPSSEDILRAEFDNYGDLFRQETNISVDIKALDGEKAKRLVSFLLPHLSKLEVNLVDLSDENAAQLMEIAGDAIDVTTEIKPTTKFFLDNMFDPQTSASVAKMKRNGILKPYKPSFKF